MLLVAYKIDTNNKVISLVQALVPIKNKVWQAWFLGYLKHYIPVLNREYHIFISNQEKGIVNIVPTIFNQAIYLYCCQYIIDNLQQRYSNKVRLLFQKAYRAKTRELFYKKIEELKAQSVLVFDYLYNIKKKTQA